jgi:hypothetical protein
LRPDVRGPFKYGKTPTAPREQAYPLITLDPHPSAMNSRQHPSLAAAIAAERAKQRQSPKVLDVADVAYLMSTAARAVVRVEQFYAATEPMGLQREDRPLGQKSIA